jgi:hypothetical protein
VEKTILWLGGCWLGALSNTTFHLIPIQRLIPHDLKQPGAISALVFIIIFILAIALVQAWAFRIEGRLSRYLSFYAGIGASILLLLAIPGLKLRIHYDLLALSLLPGTSLQTQPSLLYQSLLVGLFVNWHCLLGLCQRTADARLLTRRRSAWQSSPHGHSARHQCKQYYTQLGNHCSRL